MPKGRESGMPDASLWDTFFNVEAALSQLECDRACDVVEFGCGYGHFTVAAARRVTRQVIAVDIDPEMVAATRRLAVTQDLKNVVATQRDFMTDGSELPDGSVDYVMAFNILHIEEPQVLLQEAARLLKPNGNLAVIHWKYDAATPRGPSLSIRPTMLQCREWAEPCGFEFKHGGDLSGCPWHWGMVLSRTEEGVVHA